MNKYNNFFQDFNYLGGEARRLSSKASHLLLSNSSYSANNRSISLSIYSNI